MFSYMLLSVACITAYSNVIYAPFLHDDFPAIVNNQDVQNDSTIKDVFLNDYWGTAMKSNQSHKSYRPLTVLTFRFIRQSFGESPTPQHVVNIICHTLSTLLFYEVCKKLVFIEHPTCSILAGMLFALHPIHTEAVSNVVGRAELLSAMFFMISILLYNKSYLCNNTTLKVQNAKKEKKSTAIPSPDFNGMELRKRMVNKDDIKIKKNTIIQHCSCPRMNPTHWLWFLGVLIFGTFAMLCKETGITALAVIICLQIIDKINSSKCKVHIFIGKLMLQRIGFIILWILNTMVFRLWIMDWTQPIFAEKDNPTSFHKRFSARLLTYFYIYWINLKLLVYPVGLCYDWSYGTIPIITSITDLRNICSTILCCILFALCLYCFYLFNKKCDLLRCHLIGISLLFLPFIPASNIFFTVGFVIAERVLYLPSAGFIIIMITLWKNVYQSYPKLKILWNVIIIFYIGFYFYQTRTRNYDWTSKEALFRSDLQTAPNNAKIHYNWANYLRSNNNLTEAILEYEKTLELYPQYVSAINNLATILEDNPKTTQKAEELYARVIQIQPWHSNAYNNLAHLLIERGKYKNAVRVLLRAISNTDSQLSHAANLAILLESHNKTKHAETIYKGILEQTCVTQKCKLEKFDTQNKYAAFLYKQGHFKESMKLYQHTLNEYRNPDSLVGLSQILLDQENIFQSSNLILQAVEMDQSKVLDLWKIAATLFQKQYLKESLKLYKTVIDLVPENIKAKGQYAAVLSQLGESQKAENILTQLIQKDSGCKSIGTWKNLATLYGRQGKHKKALDLLKICEKTMVENKANLAILLCEKAKHYRDLSKIALTNKNHEEAHLHKENSIKNFNSAITMDPSFTEAKNLLKLILR